MDSTRRSSSDRSERRNRAERRGRDDRRDRDERRGRRVWSIWYGSFNPRRRSSPRRANDDRFHTLDWYSTSLLFVAASISLLSVADAFLTLMLMDRGGQELNPIMAAALAHGAALFTGFKMATTGVCVLALVVTSKYRFLRLVRVELVMYLVLGAYACLIGYELFLLHEASGAIVF